jgi:serine/threonine-protein kinase RsbW
MVPLGEERQGLTQARDRMASLSSPFPQIGWLQLREALPSMDGLGGCLLRFSQGVQEQAMLYPGDFQMYIDLLLKRLTAKGAGDLTYKVKLALDEILTNAFRHGHQGDLLRPISVELLYEPGCLRLTILDQGAGYDPLSLKDPRAIENLEADGGRGILLTHEVMDGVEFGQRTNQITLTKYLPMVAQPVSATLPPALS